MTRRVLVVHGPNLNLLGRREPQTYGATTLDEINARLRLRAADAGAEIDILQSNSESVLIERIQKLLDDPFDFLVINPAAFTHTSIALRDAIAATRIPFVEVHLSNVFSREPFRHHSYFTDIAAGMICGLGPRGYDAALDYALSRF
ncbi:MAG: type II 3-dehydroquinate dehydratase [Betaproteobacteria bacterium]|jgi:3-dehydroquinate dehydratase-2